MFISLGCARRTPRMLLRGSGLHLRPNSCRGRGAASLFSCCVWGGPGRAHTVREALHCGWPRPLHVGGGPGKSRNPPEVLSGTSSLRPLSLLGKELLLPVRGADTRCLPRVGRQAGDSFGAEWVNAVSAALSSQPAPLRQREEYGV